MPRASKDFSLKYALEVYSIANLKKYIPDVLPDLKIIFDIQINRFSKFFKSDDPYQIYGYIEQLENVTVNQTTKNRIYIVTDLDYIPFIIVDLDCSVVNKIVETFKLINIHSQEYLPPDLISTIFVFNEGGLTYTSDLRPLDVATLMAVFKNENLYDFLGARDDWYGKPRRSAKLTK